MESSKPSRRVRFGLFELDPQTGELRKSGIRIHLQEQPAKVLAMLLERPGELVTRDELKQRLWSESEFGDFDQGINVAIKKIRTALGDSTENPRFIETLSRRGYRLIAPVTTEQNGQLSSSSVNGVVPDTSAANLRFQKWTMLAGLILAVLVLGAFVLLRQPREYAMGVLTTRADIRLMPLTGALGYEMDPQFSPDGKQIAYAWSGGKDQPPDIYLKMLGAGSPVRLMPQQENVARVLPTWSPDGRFIAYLKIVRIQQKLPEVKPGDKAASVAERMMNRAENPSPDVGVYLMPAVGGEEKKLFEVTKVSDLRWWPDGKGFLISMREKASDPVSLWHFSLDGSQRQHLTNPPVTLAGDTIPAFSPDGKLIAFSRNWTSGGSDVFVMPPSGGEPRRITSDAHQLRGITFTADGQDIIYSSARQGGQRRSLWRVPLNGGIPVRLPFGSDYADNPQVAQQGNRFAFVQGHDSEQVWLYDIPVQGEVLQDPKILIGSRQMQVGARYSPDGERIVFTSDRTGSWEIWTSKADGSHPVQLTSFGERQTGTPRWSPDGKWIVFDSRPDKHSEIFVIDSEGGQPRQVTYSGGHDSVVPSFSRDGKWIYYSSNANGNWDLWRVPFDGKQAPVQLTHDQGFSGFESVDGKTIYYCKWDKPGIYSMPVNGGGESLVTIELLPRLWGAWAVAQKGIYLLIPAEKLDTKELYPELAFFDFEQKKMIHLRPTNGVPHPGPILSISPDEKKMLLSQPDVGGSDIMIVENFR